MTAEEAPGPAAGGPQITISYAGFNRAWAAWIADRLERHGCRVIQERWDPSADVPLEDALRDLMYADGHILVVLSDWYFQLGPRTTEAWNTALRTVVAPNGRRFTAVSVTTGPMPSAVTAFGGAAQLWGVGAREAERRLLTRLGIAPAADEQADGIVRPRARFPYEQPRVWGGVPRRNIRFTGRETALQAVYRRLQESGTVTLLGMSGVGKSQIAAEFVYRFSSDYDVVWWVPADQRGTLRQRLAELAPALGLTTGPEYGERLRAVRDALRRSAPNSRWLIVLDGADEPEAIADLVPEGSGHVLITSQNRRWDDYYSSLLEVPVYQRGESVAFVRRRARRIEAEEADMLAEALGDLPLALDQTAGALNDTTMPVAQYVGLLRAGADVEVGLRVSPDFPMTYYTTFSILLNRLRETVPEAVDLLRLCVFFAPGPVPLRLLRDTPLRDLPERLSSLMEDPLRWSAAVAKLVQYSVVHREAHEGGEPGSEPETLHVHRMVHQAVRAGMSEEDRDTFSRVVRRALAAADPRQPSDPRLWPRFAELVPHLEASGALHSTHREMQRLIINCLRYLYLSGEYRGGVHLAERADRAWREVLGENDPLLWDLASHHATALRATGAYARTARINREVIRHLTAERGPRDLGVLRAQDGLAADLRGLGRYQEAWETGRQVLGGYLELVGESDTRTLNAQNNLAVTLRLLGRYGEALELDRKTLEARRAALHPRHGWSLSSETNYALDLRLLGRYEEALSIQERNSDLHRTVLGADNPQTLRSELNLGMCLHRNGDRAAAGPRLAGLLERAQRVLGEDSPLTLRAAACYACVQRAHGDTDLARRIGEDTLDRYRRSLGPGHPFTVGTAANHALLLRTAGELEQSLALAEECLEGMTAAVGPDHPWTVGVALDVAVGRNLEGDPERAAGLNRENVRRASATLGAEHPLTLSCMLALASDLRALRRRQEAERTEREALAGLGRTLGPQHPHTVSGRSRVPVYWDFEPMLT
ncbi:FxSxx-COOH system tetratricopeptide repeat protein [Streptomyces sodiiphilus]|uniref:FxSxx-COOH system tetratricopeptide repeat protein n=1 Tax=Streptomyces sodiiphilus TaxID=226217 RepID=A0ABN2NVM3_9ACTN